MIEESLPSIWTFLNSWFTPTVLFVLLNLIIGTIAIVSGIGFQRHHQQTIEGIEPHLARAPSILQRLKSINLYRYGSQEINPFPPASTLQPPELDTQQTLDQNPDEVHDHHVTRSISDTKPASGDMPVKLSQKIKKSASAKSAVGRFEEEEIVEKRPSTVKGGKSKARELQTSGDDEEVDAKADDFINRFKQQLKLQRLDSILRYKELLSRGGK